MKRSHLIQAFWSQTLMIDFFRNQHKEIANSKLSIKLVDLKCNLNRLSDLRKFYNEILGLKIVSESEKFIQFECGNSFLSFEGIEHQDPFYHFAFNIPENKILEAQSWLIGKTALLKHRGREIMHFKKWNAHSLYFLDPAGNIVEFIAHHILDTKSVQQFDSNCILSIAEMGIVSNDVDQLASRISMKLEIEDFQEPPVFFKNNSFRALGHAGSMLVLSRKNRVWLMTDQKADIFDFNMTIGQGKDTNELIGVAGDIAILHSD
ncbi:MAG: hypothetical protein MRY83_19450 [Flavobacteriales bacterium]|nr:hypothetical protein [Flavobacteriales bacterium]